MDRLVALMQSAGVTDYSSLWIALFMDCNSTRAGLGESKDVLKPPLHSFPRAVKSADYEGPGVVTLQQRLSAHESWGATPSLCVQHLK